VIPVITIPEAALVATLGDNGEHWIQSSWEEGNSVCLHGAIRRCQPQPGDAYLVEQVADTQGWGPAWNDNTSTTWPMIRERIAHIEITDTDLADTFGPQWKHIVALVRRAAVLTSDEAQRLDAFAKKTDRWNNAWDGALDAAWNANGWWFRAIENAVGDAVCASAWCATDDGETVTFVEAAGREAGWALAVRHLNGQYGFTQTHYTQLTAAWRHTIGPVHPDD
jgi:hypothetical protein